MAARAGLRRLVEGPGVLAAGPDQTVARPRGLPLAGQVGRPVGNPLFLEPAVVVERVVGVQADPGPVGVAPPRQHHVAEEARGGPLEAVRALRGGPAVAAEVDVATGHRAGAAAARGD